MHKRGFFFFAHSAQRAKASGFFGFWARRFASKPPPVERPVTPPSRPYFDLSRYKTVWSKAAASVRYGLNRFQPWTSDHRMAIAYWMAFGTTWWIVAGTSTFLSLIFIIPSETFQSFVGRKVSEHVTKYTGATVTFESAIQPTWKTLRFKDVTVKRTEESSGLKDSMEIDLHFDEVDVKVSLLWMLEGKGLIESAHIKGMRGVLDRRKCWNEYDEKGELIPFSEHVPVPPEKRWRSQWYKGSFHLSQFSVSDAAVTLFQPEPTRPIRVVVHHMQSDRLRRQFLVYDMLCSTVDGSLDNRLFSLRPPNETEALPDNGEDCQQAIFHLDGVNLDIVRAGGATGTKAKKQNKNQKKKNKQTFLTI
jgi:distribution and morphology protein 31